MEVIGVVWIGFSELSGNNPEGKTYVRVDHSTCHIGLYKM